MDLILFFVALKWGLAGIAVAFTISMIIDIVIALVNYIVDFVVVGEPLVLIIAFICIVIDVILFFVFRHFGYPIKPMLWIYLVFSIVSLNLVPAVLNIIGIILFYVIIF